jgi:hypothetical protein
VLRSIQVSLRQRIQEPVSLAAVLIQEQSVCRTSAGEALQASQETHTK